MTEQELIGLRLNEFRNDLGLTQRELAQILSVQQGFVNNVIKGKKGIGHKVIINIAKAYKNLNIRWLLTGEGSMWDLENYYPPPEISSGALVLQEPDPGYCPEINVEEMLRNHEDRLRALEKRLP